MANNSRPDIQVLEARVNRIKAQLQEYKGLRLYEITKKRLSSVADELEDCLCIIEEIVGSEVPRPAKVIDLKEPEQLRLPEDFEDDLSDVLSIQLPEPSPQLDNKENYPPKVIMSTYAKRIAACKEESTGIIQVNQFCTMLDSWYQARFNPEVKNLQFRYKSQRIHEWIDLLILAAGDAIHSKMFSSFKANIDDWVSNLNSPTDGNWVLPKQVMRFKSHTRDQCTQEAVLIERIVKSTLYDEKFYNSQKDSVEKIVISSNKFMLDDLKTSEILSSCPGLIKTSSFDINKYEVGG